MKITVLAFMLLMTTAAFAQDKAQCRPLAPNDFVHPDESVVTTGTETQICRNAKTAAATTQTKPSTQAAAPAATTPGPAADAPASAPAAADAATPAAATSDAAATTNQPQATIYFYRPRRFVGSALKPSIFVDSADVGRMHNGDSLKFSVAPGTHEVYSNDKSTGLSLEAKPGQTYYVRIDIQVGAFKGHGGITLVDPQQGRYEIKAVTHQADNN